jgi:hypothetical protein
MTPHRAARPGWGCRACGLAWPCQQAKQDLVAEFEGRLAFVIFYMSAQLLRYEADLVERNERPDPTTGYRRFIGWARSATATATARPR